jgi:hypothetical protein
VLHLGVHRFFCFLVCFAAKQHLLFWTITIVFFVLFCSEAASFCFGQSPSFVLDNHHRFLPALASRISFLLFIYIYIYIKRLSKTLAGRLGGVLFLQRRMVQHLLFCSEAASFLPRPSFAYFFFTFYIYIYIYIKRLFKTLAGRLGGGSPRQSSPAYYYNYIIII